MRFDNNFKVFLKMKQKDGRHNIFRRLIMTPFQVLQLVEWHFLVALFAFRVSVATYGFRVGVAVDAC